MLYNWDDMHIFGFAFPKKPSCLAAAKHFFRLSLTREQEMLIHDAASLKPSFIIRHNLPQYRGAPNKRCMSL